MIKIQIFVLIGYFYLLKSKNVILPNFPQILQKQGTTISEQ
jgi:hypothetical protein